MVRLKAPANGGSVSIQGREYQVRKGVVDVPEHAVEALKSHGYTPVTDERDNERSAQA